MGQSATTMQTSTAPLTYVQPGGSASIAMPTYAAPQSVQPIMVGGDPNAWSTYTTAQPVQPIMMGGYYPTAQQFAQPIMVGGNTGTLSKIPMSQTVQPVGGD